MGYILYIDLLFYFYSIFSEIRNMFLHVDLNSYHGDNNISIIICKNNSFPSLADY